MSSFGCVVLTGIAATIALSTAALAADTCATRSGPVPNGTRSVVTCINATDLACPARGAVYECRNGNWYCVSGMNVSQNAPPCSSNSAGAWQWNGSEIQRVQ
jgi:hypothetical protein